MTKAGGRLCPASQGALTRWGRAFGGGYTARLVEPLRDQDCAEPAPRSNVKTVRELFAAWREVQRARVELAPYAHTNHGHRAQHLGDLPVTQVNRDALEGYVRARLAEGGSLRTIHGELTSLGHA